MVQIVSPIVFTGISALCGGYIFSIEKGASSGDIYEGAGLYGGILAAFFLGIQHIA